jgi:nucleotide-binding universal stress UspA family protein
VVARIVVGVDGSPGARRALAWAAQEAGLRQAVLQVVHAYHAKELAAPLYFPSQHALPATTVGGAGEPAPQELAASLRDHAEFEQAYRGQAEEFLEGLLGELEEPLGGVRVQPTVVADRHPAKALVDLSADAWSRIAALDSALSSAPCPVRTPFFVLAESSMNTLRRLPKRSSGPTM